MYLVTGGAGFIGSNVVAALAARGEEVVVCDWLGQDERWRNLAKHELADIVRPDDLPRWLAGRAGQVHAIVHLGAISATTETDVDLIVRNNVRATLDLWDWCAETGTRFIYASSAATYGDGDAGFDDDNSAAALARLRPLNAYGWSKQMVDRRLVRLAGEGRPRPPQWVGLKFFNVYGPNEYHKGTMRSVIAQNFAAIQAGAPMRLFRSYRSGYADGGQLRDFIYVADAVAAMLWLLENPAVSGIFNLGTGKARSWLDLSGALFAALGQAPRVEFIDMPETLRPKYQYFTEARMDRLRAAGFDHRFHSLEEGVRDYVQSFLATADPYR